MKKLFAVLLAVVLVFAMGTVALAADTGTITINNAVAGADYEIYKMADFKPIEGETDKGIYTAVDAWRNFFTSAAAVNFFDTKVVDDKLVVSLKEGVTEVTQDLAKAAIKYAEDNTIAATETKKAAGTDVEFTGLDLGYYAIDTTTGTMCALTNTNSTFKAVEKNEKPDINKQVREDSLVVDDNPESGWQYVNDADIDQVVEYRSTITVGLGAVNYIMHDTMEAGLTFNNDVVVKLADGTVVDAADYTVVYDADSDATADDCTFEVKFDDAFIATLSKGDTFTVYYSATLNKNAKVVVDGNDNTVYLTAGENSEWETEKHTTSTYTWKIDVFKYTDGDAKTPLAGAVFQLLDKDGNAIKFSKVAGEAVPTYKVDAEGTITDITTDANGKFEIVGLDEGSYSLHEVSAPEGYNKLSKDIPVVIVSEYDNDNLTASYSFAQLDENGNVKTDGDGKIITTEPVTLEVENKTGGLFPETGGIGTTIFYIVGGLLMLAAVVVLVSKKRMATFA